MPDPARETCERCFRPINGEDPGDQLMHGDGYCFDRRTERIAELEEVIESLADAANEYERERDAARAKLAEAVALLREADLNLRPITTGLPYGLHIGDMPPREWMAKRDALLESSQPHPDLIEREAREGERG